MKDGRRLARVIDNDVVDIVVVDDVRDVASPRRLRLDPLLRVPGWRAATTHAESLTIRIPRSLETPLVFTLLSHRVLCKLLRTSERPLLVVSVAVDKVVALLVSPARARLWHVIGAENASLAVAHVALTGEFAFGRRLCFSLKIALRHLVVGLLSVFDFSYDRVRLIPKVIFCSAEHIAIRVLLLFVEKVTRGSYFV